MIRTLFALFCSAAIFAGHCSTSQADQGDTLDILFLGDGGHHQPALRFRELAPPMANRGIELTYTDDVNSLNVETLAHYDGLIVYANIDRISPEQESALLNFVASGRGFIPIHCASYCFLNSDKYVELVGAQFQRHTTGTFRTEVVRPDHPIMQGFHAFESWDETYTHHRHNADRTVLEVRVDGEQREPWTWVRQHGKGRIFYTAWGHDSRTWGNPGFHNLIERGIRWATQGDPAIAGMYTDQPAMTEIGEDAAKFDYVEAEIVNYPANEKWGTIGKPLNQMQKPLTPAESATHVSIPVGFDLELVASEPEIGGKPICMNWDDRGRLWVCETVDYPNELQRPGEGRDRIRICEDTDGDGRADKFTVFAEKLSIPTSLAFAYGGVVVHQAPDTLFLKDTDGDDVADVRKTLFTGWPTGDTHAGPSNLRYGLDNWFYGMVGYAGFEGEIGGQRQSFRTGFYRFRFDDPMKSETPHVEFEFLRNTNNNSWGVGISEEGELFGSTANNNPSVHLPIPNRYYERVRGWSSSVLGSIAIDPKFDPITDKVRQVDQHGRFTAAAGHALYTARQYPRTYWNRTAFVAGPTGHLVATFQIQPDGASYISRNAWNLWASDDEWSAPIMAEVGPDGNMWVIDWYNYIVQHNPTPVGYKTGKGNAYETELRDKRHGRIYRLAVNTTAPNLTPLFAAQATPEQLATVVLPHSNMFWRLHAQRRLIEGGHREVAPQLLALIADTNVDEVGLNPGAMHALWTLHGLGLLDGSHPEATEAVFAAMSHPSAGVRRNAVAVAAAIESATPKIIASGVLADNDPHVRLAALLAIADQPSSEAAAQAVMQAMADPFNLQDRWLRDAMTSAAASSALPVLKQTAASAARSPLAPEALAIIQRVAEHWARSDSAAQVNELLAAMATGNPRTNAVILDGLQAGWPRDGEVKLSAESEDRLVALLESLPGPAQSQLVSLANRWGSKKLEEYGAKLAETLVETIQDEEAAEKARIEAARQLISFLPRNEDAVADILESISPRTSPSLAQGLIEAVGRSEAAEAGNLIVESLGSMTPSVRPIALQVLLGRADGTAALLDGVEDGLIRFTELSLDQKQRLASHPDSKIAARAKEMLASGGGLPNADRQKVLDELMPLVERQGDVAAGKVVFTKQCAKCHTYKGEGAKVGPDLTGMAIHPKKELLTHIIDPSRSVEGNFRVYTVVTDDGRVTSGLLASETRTTVEMFDAEGKRHVLQRDEIEELIASPKSLMPEGFEKQATPDDLVNLLEFLTQRGRFVPIPLDKVATIVSTKGMFHSRESTVERMAFADWSPKSVGEVPFMLVDPDGDRRPNVVLLHGPQGSLPPQMPRAVTLPCNTAAKAIHLLSGVSGWGHPLGSEGSVSLIVRLHYADGETEDHALKNGVHFADYIRRVDVPESKFAFDLDGRQIRYLSVQPKRDAVIERIELVKGPDQTAPIVMAVTIETAGENQHP